ncbi:NUDIX hydrolase [Streptomyces sp. NPDC056987]|uniref:NUDIX hydrolase n=1 Tax=Streptomyces sp. NPDC056987 TaxID=3345988 RepID=UPI0036312871
MGRRDYENDPNAPTANSLVPAASVVVVDDTGRVLLQRRVDNGMWALPGGAMHIGESLPDCVVRETREETGIDIEVIGIVGTYTNPHHVFAYDDGEVRQEFSVCFLGRPVSGRLATSEESTDVRWVKSEDVDALPMVSSIRKRLDDWRFGHMPAAR